MNLKEAVIAAAITLVVAIPFVVNYSNIQIEDVTIVGTQVKRDNNKDVYMVFTDKGVFKNTDSLLWFKFDSSDVQSILMQNKKVRVKHAGYRIPFFSAYPNVIEATPVK
jgi:hypothetical protein